MVGAKPKGNKYHLIKVPSTLYQLLQQEAAKLDRIDDGGRVFAYYLANSLITRFMRGGFTDSRVKLIEPYLISCPRSVERNCLYVDPAIYKQLSDGVTAWVADNPNFAKECGLRTLNTSNVFWAIVMLRYKDDPLVAETLEANLLQLIR